MIDEDGFAAVEQTTWKEKDGKFERTADGYPVAPLSPGYNENYYRRVVESDTTGWLKVRK